ncbi:maleylpyruvate isomerase family mycothiol-dependent enzyme [Haloechinothrix halophila]|uniref:maleylpyruvate isomerase family mycothiol-dependent enzyme n=1 Tax=Haloechinothrix halophila TaxID=1069073 RepID=UPI0004176FE2|nr:maleylpyruvate isomerase family mycothiol-dependent enzyme [Haloechinothrix halophila]
MTETQQAIATQRRELAALLTELPTARWDAPTLCEGWRVREVVAHMTMPFRHSAPRVLLEALKAGGHFGRMADRLARQDAAAHSPEELVATLRDNAEHPWRPPGGGFEGALSHDLIHSLDITVPLDLDWQVPEERLRIVHGTLTPKRIARFHANLDGVELRADDIDWSYGSGSPVTGAAQDLLLALCGRTVPEGRLRGTHSDRFSRV